MFFSLRIDVPIVLLYVSMLPFNIAASLFLLPGAPCILLFQEPIYFVSPSFSFSLWVVGAGRGYYRDEQRQRAESSGVLSGSFMNWHRQRKLHPSRKAPEMVTSDFTHVLSCRLWYECHDGFSGQMALLFLPHHDPEHLLPRSWPHLVSPLVVIVTIGLHSHSLIVIFALRSYIISVIPVAPLLCCQYGLGSGFCWF